MTAQRVLVVLVAGIFLAGCTSSGNPDESDPPVVVPTDPKAALAASTTELRAGNYAFTAQTPTGAARGAVHLASKSATVELTTTGPEPTRFEAVVVEPDRWVRLTADTSGLAAALDNVDTTDAEAAALAAGLRETVELFSGQSWLHVEAGKAKPGGDLDIDLSDPDLTGASALVAGALTVQRDNRTITGRLDASKAGGSGLLDTDTAAAMGAAAKSLPFTATLDDRGRLTRLEFDAPAADDVPAGKWSISIAGYGEQAPTAKPTGAVKEMPASGYEAVDG
ncbi:hypothetical protein [Paractinoplanes rishiriensis]|uniref:Lipoprotein n=1 Tax=Paractinoplanes rishiriensis TaxID=1050105 RepID=A0A919K5F3_9ACTN|nr:hypothetical protein [Actinoplanes rishiriensis]GIE99079.1 hypothetical protein Ari01nite_65440 [Actinoplanes rishiriensis]